MNEAVNEWVKKAEGDFHVALREYKTIDSPNYDAVCFHAQQCVEKYIKAYPISVKRKFPKTHDLELLLELALEFQPDWKRFRKSLISLTDIGVEVRYPGLFATEEMAERSLKTTKRFKKAARIALKVK